LASFLLETELLYVFDRFLRKAVVFLCQPLVCGVISLRSNILLALLAGSLAFTTVGCGGSSGPPGPEILPVVPAGGKVLHQGKPLANASVSFQHVEGKVAASGKTDAEGNFKLSTYGTDDGAPAGNYKVTVAVSAIQEIEPGVLAPEPEGGFKSPIPAKYGNPDTSGLTVEVPAGGKSDIEISLP
jgi:hypothetical protein